MGRAYELAAIWSYEGGDMSQIHRTQISIALVIVLAAAGCSDAPGVVGGEPTPPAPEPRDLVVETLVERVSILAGEELSVTCIVSEDRVQVTDVATRVTVEDEPAVDASSGVGNLVLVTRGSYRVACEGIDEDVQDEIGVVVEVLPAAPVTIETTLDQSEIPAGGPVQIGCALEDAFGNAIERDSPSSQAQTLSWSGDVSLLRESQDELSFRARGTTAGDYQIACTLGEVLADETPSELSVIPGPPAYSETTVTPSVVQATDSATVGCIVYDAYGNARVDVAATFWAQSLDGTPPLESGLWFNETTSECSCRR